MSLRALRRCKIFKSFTAQFHLAVFVLLRVGGRRFCLALLSPQADRHCFSLGHRLDNHCVGRISDCDTVGACVWVHTHLTSSRPCSASEVTSPERAIRLLKKKAGAVSKIYYFFPRKRMVLAGFRPCLQSEVAFAHQEDRRSDCRRRLRAALRR